MLLSPCAASAVALEQLPVHRVMDSSLSIVGAIETTLGSLGMKGFVKTGVVYGDDY